MSDFTLRDQGEFQIWFNIVVTCLQGTAGNVPLTDDGEYGKPAVQAVACADIVIMGLRQRTTNTIQIATPANTPPKGRRR